jgi:hypothetical protein
VTVYEALPEERAAVRAYALKHPEVRHHELAWRMVDEKIAFADLAFEKAYGGWRWLDSRRQPGLLKA